MHRCTQVFSLGSSLLAAKDSSVDARGLQAGHKCWQGKSTHLPDVAIFKLSFNCSQGSWCNGLAV